MSMLYTLVYTYLDMLVLHLYVCVLLCALDIIDICNISYSETLNSIKVKRSQAGERKELSLPATVMLSGSFLGSSNNTSTFSESSDGKVGEVDQKASARVKLSNSKIEYRGISAYERVSKHSSIERHKLPSLHNNSKLTRPSTSRPEGKQSVYVLGKEHLSWYFINCYLQVDMYTCNNCLLYVNFTSHNYIGNYITM